MDDPILDSRKAAEYLGISRHTIAAWACQGKLRRTKVGARTMFRRSELERFVADCNQPNKAA